MESLNDICQYWFQLLCRLIMCGRLICVAFYRLFTGAEDVSRAAMAIVLGHGAMVGTVEQFVQSVDVDQTNNSTESTVASGNFEIEILNNSAASGRIRTACNDGGIVPAATVGLVPAATTSPVHAASTDMGLASTIEIPTINAHLVPEATTDLVPAATTTIVPRSITTRIIRKRKRKHSIKTARKNYTRTTAKKSVESTASIRTSSPATCKNMAHDSPAANTRSARKRKPLWRSCKTEEGAALRKRKRITRKCKRKR